MSMSHIEIDTCKVIGRVLRDELPVGSAPYKEFFDTTKCLVFARVLTENKPEIIDALVNHQLSRPSFPMDAVRRQDQALKLATIHIQQIIDRALIDGDQPPLRRQHSDGTNHEKHWIVLRDVIGIALLDSTNVAVTA